MKRGQPMRRGGRLRRVGARAEREAEALAAAVAVVRNRCGCGENFMGTCERCGWRAKIEVHHMKRNPRVHEPGVMAALCRHCHAAVHSHSATDWRDWFLSREPAT